MIKPSEENNDPIMINKNRIFKYRTCAFSLCDEGQLNCQISLSSIFLFFIRCWKMKRTKEEKRKFLRTEITSSTLCSLLKLGK